MRRVFLYGKLAEQFGSEFRLRGNTVAAIVKLLEANFQGRFLKALLGNQYRVVAGKDLDDEKSIQFDHELVKSQLNLGSKDLHIYPVAQGAGGVFRVVLGVALIATALVLSGGTAAGLAGSIGGSLGAMGVSYGSIALFGASMVLGGISQLLTPTAKVADYGSREAPDARPSFLFNGAVNTVEQGGPIPVVYGRMRIGSTVISGGITAEQTAV